MKTASTTIGRSILEHYGLVKFRPHHVLPNEIVEKVGKKRFMDAFRILFVRNPYDRVVSGYEFSKSYKEWGKKRDISFDEFIENLHHPLTKFSFFPMYQYCFLEGRNIIEFMGYFEHLHRDINKMLDIVGIPKEGRLPIPHIRQTPHKPYQEYYTDGNAQERVYELYKEDFEIFGYNKEII